MGRGPENRLAIDLSMSGDFDNLPEEDKQVEIANCIKQLGQHLHERHGVKAATYISVLISSAGLYAGFCARTEEDRHFVELRINCPKIVEEMIKTLGQFVGEGMKQRAQTQQMKGVSKDTLPN